MMEDSVYSDWIIKWRRWRFAWCREDDPLLVFYITFVPKRGYYPEEDHVSFANKLSDNLPITSFRVHKSGRISIRMGSTVEKSVEVVENTRTPPTVTMKLCFFTRSQILQIALLLERLGHGVIHDQGRVVVSSRRFIDDFVPRMMPSRDDPVWTIVETSMHEFRVTK